MWGEQKDLNLVREKYFLSGFSPRGISLRLQQVGGLKRERARQRSAASADVGSGFF